jgi:hypothetical protein
MRKLPYLLLIISFFFLLTSVTAGPVDRVKAEKVARNFLGNAFNIYGTGKSHEQLTLSDPYIYQAGGLPVFYAFGTNPGFIVISAEDAYEPVIGYSYDGSFDLDGAPSHYLGFMLNYADQISFIRDQGLAASDEIRESWEALVSGNQPYEPAGPGERDVEPLLSGTWDQGSPYNIYCPEDPAGPGGHTWVGCVATAMAQIMYYWRYPETGTGSHCYTPGNMSYGIQCADFENTQYNWEGMINGIDNKNPEANAELQYHCAVSVNMNFSPDGSGSYSYLVPGRLSDYFRYTDAQYLEKQNYNLTTWISMLKAELDEGHPLYYSGYNPSQGGHAFVCDGYQGDNFHFNFGWSGSGNGYYTLSDVGGFNQGQAIVRYFVPSETDYPYHATGNKVITGKSGSLTDGSGPVEDYLDNTNASWLIDPQTIQDSISSVKLDFSRFDLAEGDSVRIYDGSTSSDPLLGAFSGNAIPPRMESSSNRMLITFTTNGSVTAPGWYAEFSTVTPTWCNGLTQLTEPTGTFGDGSGNFLYQSGAACLWRIAPPDAGKVILNFTSFETEEGVDRMKIFDNQTQIAELSGNELPDQIVANSGIMFITWTTSSTNNFQGWEAFYEVDNVIVDEIHREDQLQIYPNPSSGQLNVELGQGIGEHAVMEISNPAGQVFYSATLTEGTAGRSISSINTEAWPGGVYFLKVSTVSYTTVRKVIVD